MNFQGLGWNKYDDPNTISNNIIVELNKLGISTDYPAPKLKNGYGLPVCSTIHKVALKAMNFKGTNFKGKPVFGGSDEKAEDKEEKDATEEVVDDLDREDLNVRKEAVKVEEKPEEGKEGESIITSHIAAEEWMKEVERVSAQLKMNQGGDIKEWRTHIEQAKKYAEKTQQCLPNVKIRLEKLSDDVSNALDRISKKELVINKNFNYLLGDYKAQAESNKELRANYNQLNESVQKQQQQLIEIKEKLEELQSKMNEQGSTMTDISPVMKIKKAIHTMKADINNLDIRIGVVSNTLLHLKMKATQRLEKKNNAEPELGYIEAL
jgi:estrogen-related receptor beta like 1